MSYFLDRRFILFCLVGGSGVFVDLGFFQFLQAVVGVPVMWASLSSALIAMTSNFILNSIFTWAGHKEGRLWVRFLRFVAVSALGIGIKLMVLYVLYRGFGIHQLLANALGIAVATLWNYTLNRFWTFRMKKDEKKEADGKTSDLFVKRERFEAGTVQMISRAKKK